MHSSLRESAAASLPPPSQLLLTKAGCAAPPDSMNMGSLIEQLNEPALRSARMHADADDMEYEEEDLLFGSQPPVRPVCTRAAC